MKALAIDGPAGAGKSTVARAVADALGWRYVDSGAMYRAVAHALLERGLDASSNDAAGEVAERAAIDVDGTRVWLDGAEVTKEIRSPEVTRLVPLVATHPRVRAALVDKQRRLAEAGDVVMEGRDIGTAVVPDAQTKVYLTASVEERARRRALELGLPPDDATVRAMAETISDRDTLDSTRDVSPLQRAPDAHLVDTTGLTLDEVVARICEIVGDRAR